MNKNLFAVILAGGTGTRFWPKSRKRYPKQFLPLFRGDSLFQKTLRRMSGLVSPRQTLVVSNEVYAGFIKKQGAQYGLLQNNILLEPAGRNTAPAICWAARTLYERNPQAVMLVLPADHLILHEHAFYTHVRQALSLAAQDFLVTLGIVPTRPETGYGYLKVKSTRASRGTPVERFVEKPDLAKAKAFLKARKYLWNSGMFIWRCDKFLRECRRYLPQVYRFFRDRGAGEIRKDWGRLPSISVDYGMLEKSPAVMTVPASRIGWSDVGSWEALAGVLASNQDGNFFQGEVVGLDCRNTFIWGQKRLVAAVGLEDLVVVDTDDAVFICPKKKSQLVKKIVGCLTDKNKNKYL